ncbi:hypothetical protein [Pedobacter zeae]|uniref:Uncharacterized protein n=1 Tax=Pedobacter zeae TaxID=1737356 RepID=A0A7W6KBQ6_9SPHI|nr:hypothetical protein [Pedobacter zeae]MBB4107750.1 hypothetical protein [Pedobacter zeae]GGG97278.1 hypothetical protein GCM10007422_09040 [Pedobacter zeae]
MGLIEDLLREDNEIRVLNDSTFRSEGEAFLFILYTCLNFNPTWRQSELSDIVMLSKKKNILKGIDTSVAIKRFFSIQSSFGIHEPTKLAIGYLSSDSKAAIFICCLDFTLRFTKQLEGRSRYIDYLIQELKLDNKTSMLIAEIFRTKYL